MDWLWWIAALVAGGFVLDRLALVAEAKGWIRWRKRSSGAAGAGMFGELMDAFQPSRRVVAEERQRQNLQVNAAESGAPGLIIDLDAEVAHITVARPTTEPPIA